MFPISFAQLSRISNSLIFINAFAFYALQFYKYFRIQFIAFISHETYLKIDFFLSSVYLLLLIYYFIPYNLYTVLICYLLINT